MKAYVGGLYSSDESGNAVVFAKNAKEAKSKFMEHHRDIAGSAESYIDIYTVRAPEFDGMENASFAELMCEKWRQGWWFYQGDAPDVETASDEDFYEWYEENFS